MSNAIECKAVDFILGLLPENESQPLETVVSSIPEAPDEVREFLEQCCKTVDRMEEFLQSYAEYFLIKNGRVARVKEDTSVKDDFKKPSDNSQEELSSGLPTKNEEVQLETGPSVTPKVPEGIKPHLEKLKKNVEEVEEFLQSYEEYFPVENRSGAKEKDTREKHQKRQTDDSLLQSDSVSTDSPLIPNKIERKAIKYISDYLQNAVGRVEAILFDINKAPEKVKRYLQQHCRTVEEMDQFLNKWNEYFVVTNGWVKVKRPKTVDYIKEALDSFFLPRNSVNFGDHLDFPSAPDAITRKTLKYISDFLDDQVCTMEEVLLEIDKAPAKVKRYLERQKRTVEDMEEFFGEWEEYFIVENLRVAVKTSQLESGRLKAVDYFREALDLYVQHPNLMNFRGHIGQADDDVINFMNSFYPGEEFRQFLLNHPDVFVLYEDDTVYLVENESVEYFDECLENYGEGVHFMSLRGHIGQAPSHVIDFINRHYPGEKFIEFLENNLDVFTIDINGYVYLNPDDSAY